MKKFALNLLFCGIVFMFLQNTQLSAMLRRLHPGGSSAAAQLSAELSNRLTKGTPLNEDESITIEEFLTAVLSESHLEINHAQAGSSTAPNRMCHICSHAVTSNDPQQNICTPCLSDFKTWYFEHENPSNTNTVKSWVRDKQMQWMQIQAQSPCCHAPVERRGLTFAQFRCARCKKPLKKGLAGNFEVDTAAYVGEVVGRGIVITGKGIAHCAAGVYRGAQQAWHNGKDS
jgi:hypothetical protein